MSLKATGQYSPLLLDYVANQKKLRPFYGHPPTLAGLKAQIKAKESFPQAKREHLQQLLQKQYQGLSLSPQMEDNLRKLGRPNTFVITTAHQLNICTGPLYLPYKILSTLALARTLGATYPSYHFVPLFWMHSEDHDVPEINHFYFKGEYYEAKLPKGGPVGTLSAVPVAALLQKIPECLTLFKAAYAAQSTLSAATRQLLHALFAEAGLWVLDPMDAALKKALYPLLVEDLSGRIAAAFEQHSAALKALGYKLQLSARPLHFFYMKEQHRGALLQNNESFSVKGTDITFADEAALLQTVKAHPEYLSPSAALRPLYQEAVLPSIAYVGGPAEIAYWLQLKKLFSETHIPMPVLVPRFFGALLPAPVQRKCKKLGLSWTDLFLPTQTLQKKLLPTLEEYSFSKEQAQMKALFSAVEARTVHLDASLGGYVRKRAQMAGQILHEITNKLRQNLLSREDQHLRSVHILQSWLCPENMPQERYMNLMNFLEETPELLKQLLEQIDPLDMRFHFALLDDK